MISHLDAAGQRSVVPRLRSFCRLAECGHSHTPDRNSGAKRCNSGGKRSTTAVATCLIFSYLPNCAFVPFSQPWARVHYSRGHTRLKPDQTHPADGSGHLSAEPPVRWLAPTSACRFLSLDQCDQSKRTSSSKPSSFSPERASSALDSASSWSRGISKATSSFRSGVAAKRVRTLV